MSYPGSHWPCEATDGSVERSGAKNFPWWCPVRHGKLIKGRRTRRRRSLFVTVIATVLLGMAIVLFSGTILVYFKTACAQPSRVREIRHLRQEGLAVQHDEA